MDTSTVESDVWSLTSSALHAQTATERTRREVSRAVIPILASGASLVFFVLAARRFAAADVGVGAALIALSSAVAEGARRDFGQVAGQRLAGIERFSVPPLISIYAGAAGVAFCGALVFVLAFGPWAVEVADPLAAPGSMLLFVALTGCWGAMRAGEEAFRRLDAARWLLVGYGVFGLAQFGMLWGLSSSAYERAVFWAWSAPVVVALAGGFLLLRRLEVDRPEGWAHFRRMSSTPRRLLVVRLAHLARMAVLAALPLIVLARVGSGATAHLVVAGTLTHAVYVLNRIAVEAAVPNVARPHAAPIAGRLRATAIAAAASVPLVALGVLLAPFVLGAFGPEYVDQAGSVFRLLLVGIVPGLATHRFIDQLRSGGRAGGAGTIVLGMSLALVFMGLALVGLMGVVGVGVAWLATLTVVALAVVGIDAIEWWAPRLDRRVVERAIPHGGRLRRLALRLPNPSLDRDVRQILRARYTKHPRWRRVELSTDIQTVAVAAHEGRPPLRLEVARTLWGNQVLTRRRRSTFGLAELTGLTPLLALVPYPIEHDTAGAHHLLLESALSGRPGAVVGRPNPEPLAESVSEVMAELHQATAATVNFDAEALDRWVSKPLQILKASGSASPDELAVIDRSIRKAVGGMTFPSARLHGNLTLHNALFDPAAKLTGLINWEWSEVGPAFLDRASLALSALALTEGHDLGSVVVRLLRSPDQFLAHPALKRGPLPDIDGRALILLAWLHRVAPTFQAGSSPEAQRFRIARDVRPVLASLSPTDESAEA